MSLNSDFSQLLLFAGTVLAKLSDGDFQGRISSDFRGDFATVKDSTNHMAKNLQAVIKETVSKEAVSKEAVSKEVSMRDF